MEICPIDKLKRSTCGYKSPFEVMLALRPYHLNIFKTMRRLKYYKSRFLTKPERVKLLALIFRTLTRNPNPKKWVFVVGCYNSGTTLLTRLLSIHPSISSLLDVPLSIAEGAFITSELITPEELGWTRMWYKVADQVRLKAGDKSINIKALKKDWAIFFDRKKPIFLEKSIVNSARMTWLQENFNNSYFIFIVRNGYAVAEGIRRRVQKGEGQWGMQQDFSQTYPIELCAEQWIVNNQVIEEDSKAIKNFKRVQYEKLCASPRQVIEELWDFIGINNSRLHNNPVDRDWKTVENDSPIKNMNEWSIANLSSLDIMQIDGVVSDMLEHYGYPILSSENELLDVKKI